MQEICNPTTPKSHCLIRQTQNRAQWPGFGFPAYPASCLRTWHPTAAVASYELPPPPYNPLPLSTAVWYGRPETERDGLVSGFRPSYPFPASCLRTQCPTATIASYELHYHHPLPLSTPNWHGGPEIEPLPLSFEFFNQNPAAIGAAASPSLFDFT